MVDLGSVPGTLLFFGFAATALIILLGGLRMTSLADRLADMTGWGEAIIGGVLLGAATSLSGAVVSLTAAIDGRASMAFSNGIGGIAAQTAFLGLADLVYRRANLEHAGAELANVFQAGVLTLLLALPLMAFAGPEVSLLGLHPVSYALPVLYVVGVIAARQVREDPMWRPVRTHETRDDIPEEEDGDPRARHRVIGSFLGLMIVMALAGWCITQLSTELAGRAGISDTVAGALMTATVTSLPELVTTLAAVRRGALQLAIGGIIGGNTFDILFLTISDAGFRDGSIYHAINSGDLFWLATGLAMTSVLLLGLIFRQKDGPAGIGVESVLLLTIYAGAVGIGTTLG